MLIFRRKKTDKYQRAIDRRTDEALSQWVKNKRHLLEMTASEAAEEMNLSREQMAYYFRMYKGQDFRSWRKTMRIKEACRLIRERQDLPFSVIGEYVGISDKSNFRREFFEVCGVLPAEWKRRHCR